MIQFRSSRAPEKTYIAQQCLTAMEMGEVSMERDNVGRNPESIYVDREIEKKIVLIKADPSKYPAPRPPSLPLMNPTMSMSRRLSAIQRYILAFEYNYTGRTFVSLHRERGMRHLLFSAKVLMRECLPIQCVEALFIGVYLSNGIEDLLRIPISFKSTVDGKEFYHIVLGLRYRNKWCAIGISRLKNLMYKPLRYGSLLALIQEFDKSYSAYYHKMTDINLGLPFSHNRASENPLQWKLIKMSLEGTELPFYEDLIYRYCKDSLLILHHYEATGKLPNWCDEVYLSGRKSRKEIKLSPRRKDACIHVKVTN